MTLSSDEQRIDWAAGKKGLLLAWGLPIGAMLIAIFIDPLSKMIIWITALVWMGSACLLNARRCGRRSLDHDRA